MVHFAVVVLILKCALEVAIAAPAPVALPAPLPAPTPLGIPSGSSAETMLNDLTVRGAGTVEGYRRPLFPHWSFQSGSCNTREVVLARDGVGVVQDSLCRATSGTWFSPYDNKTWYDADEVDIDHLVPLADAWRSGASIWTTDEREQFANDVTTPQLWAVTDKINQEKSDKTPDRWKPPVTEFHCTYASSWIAVKYAYDLSVTSAEKDALSSMLTSC